MPPASVLELVALGDRVEILSDSDGWRERKGLSVRANPGMSVPVAGYSFIV